MAHPIEALERQRAAILQQLQALGDMRRGSIVEQYLRCGKAPCCCRAPRHPGHGPYFAYTRKVQGKTQTRQLRPGPVLTKLAREVETYHRFRQFCDQLLAVNERLCELRPLAAAQPGSGIPAVKKTSRRPSKRRSGGRSTAS